MPHVCHNSMAARLRRAENFMGGKKSSNRNAPETMLSRNQLKWQANKDGLYQRVVFKIHVLSVWLSNLKIGIAFALILFSSTFLTVLRDLQRLMKPNR